MQSPVLKPGASKVCTLAKTAERSSLQAEEAMRAPPYAASMVAGSKGRMGEAHKVAPVGSRVRASTAYLKVKGTCRLAVSAKL